MLAITTGALLAIPSVAMLATNSGMPSAISLLVMTLGTPLALASIATGHSLAPTIPSKANPPPGTIPQDFDNTESLPKNPGIPPITQDLPTANS
ncbi:hypothetical protein PGT21_008562 [Puccinia graminis f. sp. tritici]|uniref:Uncharacterized protein n=1 Tax=Puccinia graminis f. sp. tritici TaxID=56615 RepID=A0A5B0NIK5_PUCGR|nr:hypothetical protein PGT21_008562 [Puccinia graminis f. sp. tritici]